MCVSEIRVKRIRVNQGLAVYKKARICNLLVGQYDEFSQTNYYLTLSYFKETPK